MSEVVVIFSSDSNIENVLERPICPFSVIGKDMGKPLTDFSGVSVSIDVSIIILIVHHNLSLMDYPSALLTILKEADTLSLLYHTLPEIEIINSIIKMRDGKETYSIKSHHDKGGYYHPVFTSILSENDLDYKSKYLKILDVIGVTPCLEAKLTLLHSLLDQKVDMDSLWDRLVSRCNDLLQYETVWVEYMTSIRTDSKTWNEALTVLRDSLLK